MKSLRQRWAGLALAAGVCGVVFAAVGNEVPVRPLTGLDAISADLSRPDALIETENLSALPADVIRAPLLKDLLTEDFAFYYQDLDTRLDVLGAIKRLAFEHDLTLGDRLLDAVFDEPAQVAFWRGDGGRLRHWMLSGTRNGIARSLEALGRVAADDSQLSHVADLGGAPGIPVYALRLNTRSTLLFAARGDRLVVLSHPALLLDETGKPIAVRAKAVLGALADTSEATLAAAPRTARHRLSVGMDVLAQGYGQFMPGVRGLRFELVDGTWQTALQFSPGSEPAAALKNLPWSALPEGAAFCAGLPLDAERLAALAPGVAIKAHLGSSAAACWYEAQGWQSPLIAVELHGDSASLAPVLGGLFEQWIGAREFEQETGRFPVRQSRQADGAHVWRREVSARYGELTVPGERRQAFSADRYFDVSLALAGNVAVFSPSAALVDQSLDTLARRYPSVADHLAAGPALFLIDPPRLGRFLETATSDIGEEPGASLKPRYAALAEHPARAASLGGGADSDGWQAVDWTALK